MISNWCTLRAPWRSDGAQAVRAGVAAADDDHPLVLGGDRRLARRRRAPGRRGWPCWPTAGTPSPDGCRRTRGPGSAGRASRWPHRPAPRRRTRSRSCSAVMSTPTLTPATELGALGLHLLQAAVDVALLHLELGDAVAQQPADAVGALEHGDVMTGPGELLGGGQPGRTGADDGHRLAGHQVRRVGLHPALVQGVVDDLDLDLLDGHRVGVDAQHAGRLARRRAQPAGELREVVGGVQPLDGVVPAVPVDQVVPLRDQVAQRTTVVAERDPAVHAAGRLVLQGLVVEVLVDLFPVPQAQRHRPPRRQSRGGCT